MSERKRGGLVKIDIGQSDERVTFREFEEELERARRGGPEDPIGPGICRVCDTPTVVPTMRRQEFTMSTPIGPPLSQYQDGWHCTSCGIRYEFATPRA